MMKIVVLVGLLWMILAGLGPSLFAQDCPRRVLSSRVGRSVDLAERTYFGIFPNRPGFVSATVHQCADTLAYTWITTQPASGTRAEEKVPATPEAFDALARYIDRFEAVYLDTERVAWGQIFEFARPVPRMPRGLPLTVVTTGSTTHTGHLLHIDSSGLVLSTGSPFRGAPFTPSAARYVSAAQYVSARSAEYVAADLPFLQRLIAEPFVLPASDTSRFKTHVVHALQEHARYRRALSPELHEYLQQVRDADPESARRSSNPTVVRSAYRQRLRRRVHLAVASGVNVLYNRASYSVTLDYFDQRLDAPKIRYNFPRHALTADLSLTSRWRVGATIAFPTPRAKPPGAYQRVSTRSDAHDMLADSGSMEINVSHAEGMVYYVVKPLDPLALGVGSALAPYRALELQVGAGVTYSQAESKTALSSGGRRASSDAFIIFGETWTQRSRGVGGAVAARASSYITRHLSVNLSTRFRALSGLRIRDRRLESPSGYRPAAKTLSGFSQPAIVATTIQLGISLHL